MSSSALALSSQDYGVQHQCYRTPGIWYPVESSLKRSAARGCARCSVLYTGIVKCQEACRLSKVGLYLYPLREFCMGLGTQSRVLELLEQIEFYTDSGMENIPYTLYLLILIENGSQIEGIQHRRHVQAVLDLSLALQFVRRQLSRCENNHKCLPHEAVPPLPRRVLDVGAKHDDNISLHEICGEKVPYVALSHCWGANTMLKTTNSNYDDRIAGII